MKKRLKYTITNHENKLLMGEHKWQMGYCAYLSRRRDWGRHKLEGNLSFIFYLDSLLQSPVFKVWSSFFRCSLSLYVFLRLLIDKVQQSHLCKRAVFIMRTQNHLEKHKEVKIWANKLSCRVVWFVYTFCWLILNLFDAHYDQSTTFLFFFLSLLF